MTVTISWKDSTGVTTALTEANGYSVLRDTRGLDAPPVEHTLGDYVNVDGAAQLAVRRGVRPIILPLHIKHATRVQTRVEQLAGLLLNAGELIFADGTNTRTLKNVIYESGLEGDLGRDVSGPPKWRKVALSLIALDPWWYAAAVAASLPVAAATTFDAAVAFDAVLPFDGGASLTVSVVGHAEAFPVVTVVGPATQVTVGVGDLTWQTNVALSATDTLIVDTRPGNRGPRRNAGTVDWSLLTAASRLWTLAPGSRSIVVGVSGSTGATSVSLSYEPRWSSP